MLLVLIALRTNLTERALAAIFGVSQPTVHRVIAALLPRIAALFDADPADLAKMLLLDGTLIPVHDQTFTRPSKNYRRSVNVQVVANVDRKVVQVRQCRRKGDGISRAVRAVAYLRNLRLALA